MVRLEMVGVEKSCCFDGRVLTMEWQCERKQAMENP